MIPRATAVVVGCLILAAAAHVTIQATGGYGTPHSWLTMAIAIGVAGASVYSGMAWTDGRMTIAVGLIFAIVAGEAYGLVATAERLIAGREESQAPLRRLAEDRARAQRRLEDSIRAKEALSSTSPRLERALADKAATVAAVVSKSAERGCVENCRKLLQAQADAAELEVGRARDEIARKVTDAERAITDAKRDLDAMRPPTSATPLADRLGLSAWVLDLIVAALGSIAANGLACFLIVFGAHRPKNKAPTETTAEAKQEPTRELGASPVARAPGRQSGAKLSSTPAAEPEIEHAKRFAVARLRPAASAAADIKAVVREYGSWCKAAGAEPLSPQAIIEALDNLFEIERRGDSYVLLDVAMKGTAAKLQ